MFSVNSFSGSALKAAPRSDSSLKMATGMGVNGFGRIGRLVTRVSVDEVVHLGITEM